MAIPRRGKIRREKCHKTAGIISWSMLDRFAVTDRQFSIIITDILDKLYYEAGQATNSLS